MVVLLGVVLSFSRYSIVQIKTDRPAVVVEIREVRNLRQSAARYKHYENRDIFVVVTPFPALNRCPAT